MKDRDECLYYLVRELDGLGPKANPIYLDSILEHIRRDGIVNVRWLEFVAVAEAARTRGRLKELAEATERWHDTQKAAD